MNNFFVALQIMLMDRIERNDRGATAVEYGLMVSLIAVVIITAVALIGTNLDAMFDAVAGRITAVIP